jgi:hypothetical protein
LISKLSILQRVPIIEKEKLVFTVSQSSVIRQVYKSWEEDYAKEFEGKTCNELGLGKKVELFTINKEDDVLYAMEQIEKHGGNFLK